MAIVMRIVPPGFTAAKYDEVVKRLEHEVDAAEFPIGPREVARITS